MLRDYVGEFPKLVAQSAFEEMRDDPTWGAEDRFLYGVISAMVFEAASRASRSGRVSRRSSVEWEHVSAVSRGSPAMP